MNQPQAVLLTLMQGGGFVFLDRGDSIALLQADPVSKQAVEIGTMTREHAALVAQELTHMLASRTQP